MPCWYKLSQHTESFDDVDYYEERTNKFAKSTRITKILCNIHQLPPSGGKFRGPEKSLHVAKSYATYISFHQTVESFQPREKFACRRHKQPIQQDKGPSKNSQFAGVNQQFDKTKTSSIALKYYTNKNKKNHNKRAEKIAECRLSKEMDTRYRQHQHPIKLTKIAWKLN